MQTTDSSVSSLIMTFTRSLDYFKDIRDQRRKKKAFQVNKKKEALRGDELKLSMSLRQGPIDIQREYEKNYRANGDRYALGDPIASASLARAIRRLNAGLLSIISSFLSCGQEKTRLDYKYLTSVSELSRQEALDALSQLNTRIMSRSALPRHDERRKCTHPTEKGRCVRGCPRKLTSPDSKASLKPISKLAKQTSRDTQEARSPEVRRIQSRDSSRPELAIVRPRARRTKSSTSVATNEPSSTPPPPPAYSPPAPPQFIHHPYAPSAIPNPYVWTPLSPGHRRPLAPDHEGLIVHAPYPLSPPLPACTEHADEAEDFVPHASLPTVRRRRVEKFTPSMYTTVSKASTNLGEIPMSRWNRPWDAEEMGRKNEAVRDKTWVSSREVGEERGQRKRGWWKLLTGGRGMN